MQLPSPFLWSTRRSRTRPSIVDARFACQVTGNAGVEAAQSSETKIPFASTLVLFVAESDHGVNLHGATRGNEAGQGCYGSKNERDGCEGNRIVRGNAEKQETDEARGGERTGYSNKQPSEREEQSFAQDHAKNCATRSAERDAYSDFVGSACDGIGNHAEDSGSGKNQGHGSEETE